MAGGEAVVEILNGLETRTVGNELWGRHPAVASFFGALSHVSAHLSLFARLKAITLAPAPRFSSSAGIRWHYTLHPSPATPLEGSDD